MCVRVILDQKAAVKLVSVVHESPDLKKVPSQAFALLGVAIFAKGDRMTKHDI